MNGNIFPTSRFYQQFEFTNRQILNVNIEITYEYVAN